MGMLMILREDYRKYKYNLSSESSSNNVTEDPFFSKNWDAKVGTDDLYEVAIEDSNKIGFNKATGVAFNNTRKEYIHEEYRDS